MHWKLDRTMNKYKEVVDATVDEYQCNLSIMDWQQHMIQHHQMMEKQMIQYQQIMENARHLVEPQQDEQHDDLMEEEHLSNDMGAMVDNLQIPG